MDSNLCNLEINVHKKVVLYLLLNHKISKYLEDIQISHGVKMLQIDME